MEKQAFVLHLLPQTSQGLRVRKRQGAMTLLGPGLAPAGAEACDAEPRVLELISKWKMWLGRPAITCSV